MLDFIPSGGKFISRRTANPSRALGSAVKMRLRHAPFGLALRLPVVKICLYNRPLRAVNNSNGSGSKKGRPLRGFRED